LTAARWRRVFPQLSWFHQGMQRGIVLIDRTKLEKA
jgi:hypothetical protein